MSELSSQINEATVTSLWTIGADQYFIKGQYPAQEFERFMWRL